MLVHQESAEVGSGIHSATRADSSFVLLKISKYQDTRKVKDNADFDRKISKLTHEWLKATQIVLQESADAGSGIHPATITERFRSFYINNVHLSCAHQRPERSRDTC